MKHLKALAVAVMCLVFLAQSVGVAVAQDEESFVRPAATSKQDVIVLSLLYPGLGQLTAGKSVKGMGFFLAETISLITFINANEKYNTEQKVYDRDLNIYNALATRGVTSGQMGHFNEAFSMYNDLKSRNDDLNSFNTLRNTAIIIAGAVYAYNLVDAIFFSSSSNQNEQMMGIFHESIQVSSAMIDRAPGIVLSKRF